MGGFEKLVKKLSKDAHLLENKVLFRDCLGISAAKMGPSFKHFDMRHCTPYELIRIMLSEWISIKKDSATIAELRRYLREDGFLRLSDKLEGLQEQHPGPIKIPYMEMSKRNFIIAAVLVSFVSYLAFKFCANPLGAIPQPCSSGNQSPMETGRMRPIAFGLKPVVKEFTGREEELRKLNEYFHSRECPIVLISGLGGIGKTEVARKFALDITDNSGNGQIVKCWLSGENPQSLLNSIAQFCHLLQLPTKDSKEKPLPIQEMIQNIMAKLKSSEAFGRWVIIIDNVDDIHPEFETALKTLSKFGPDAFLLVTSRRRDIFPGKLKFLEVKEMRLENSMEFVRKSLEISDNSSDDAIKSLCEILGNFPLALNQASAFIGQQQSTSLMGTAYKIQNYLEELAKTETLGLDEPDEDQILEYSTPTLKVWNITIDKIREDYGADGQLALDLLDAMAFINPDDIPIPFLQKLYKRFYSIEEISLTQIKDSLKILLNYSLISSYDELLSIHRLVQLSSRDRMSKSPAEDPKQRTKFWLYRFVQLFQRDRMSSFPSKDVQMLTKFWTSFHSSDWNQIEMRNILTIWNHTPLHEELNSHRAVKILSVQIQLQILGMVNEAYDFSESSKFVRELYEPEDIKYLAMEFSLALALRGKGQYESALEKFTSHYAKLKDLHGAEDEMTLSAGYYIADVLCDLEIFEECLEWAQRILQPQIKINGENNGDVMRIKGTVAMALQYLGRTTEALEIYLQVLKWEEANLSANHPSTLGTRHNIAACLYSVGMFAEALKFSQWILPQMEKLVGSEHPVTLTTKTLLAGTLFEMGEIDQALKIAEEVLIAREKVLGAEHPQTIYVREKLTLYKDKM